jgi:tetraacyldisaccharide 4'-kinase
VSLLERTWWAARPAWPVRLLRAPLRVLALLFGLAVAVRGWLFDRGLLAAATVGAPVLSIGNLVVGGAGKTPVTVAIARRLAGRGRTVAILSRGYGASRRDARVVADGHGLRLSAGEGGDEPVLMARRLPGVRVLCGPSRVELARRAVETLGADALVLDDGLQHRRLARDLDVVVLDAAHPVGNGLLLPAGPNREPPTALGRAGLLWLSRVDQADPASLERWRALARRETGREAVESRHAPVDLLDGTLTRSLGLPRLRGLPVLLLSGLARPGAFRRTVEELGARVVGERRHPDHHRFGAADLEAAFSAAQAAGAALVVTTEKDAVRLDAARAGDPRLAVLTIEVELLAGAAALEEALDAALAAGDRRRAQVLP